MEEEAERDPPLPPPAATMKITREPPLKQLMKYAVPAVLPLLMLRHQRKPDALFRDNPAPLWCFVAANAVYWLVAEAMTTRCCQRQQLILRRGALAFGVLAALSLLSMFLPHHFSLLPLAALPLAFVWICTPLMNAIGKVRAMAFVWICTPLMNAIGKVRAMVVRNGGVDLNNQLRTLPVSLPLDKV